MKNLRNLFLVGKRKFNFVLLLIFLPFNFAWSFSFNNSGEAAFDRDVIKVNVFDDAASECGGTTTPAELLELTKTAIEQYWNRVPTSSLFLEVGSLVSSSKPYATENLCNPGTSCTPNENLKVDNDILITCNIEDTASTGNFTSAGILGKTIPNNTSGAKIMGSLILINGCSTALCGFDNLFDTLERDEKVAVIAHELGHALGLGHSPVKDSLMYYSIIPNRRSLGWDDIDGITYLYPTLQPLGSSCGTIAEVTKNSGGPPNGPMSGLLNFAVLMISLLLASRIKLNLGPSKGKA